MILNLRFVDRHRSLGQFLQDHGRNIQPLMNKYCEIAQRYPSRGRFFESKFATKKLVKMFVPEISEFVFGCLNSN